MATKRRKVRKTKSHRRSRKSCKHGKLKRKVKSRSGRKRRCKKKKSRRRKRTYKINPIIPADWHFSDALDIFDLQRDHQRLRNACEEEIQRLRNACEEEIQRLRNENQQLQMSIFSLIINNDHRHGDSTNLNPDDFEDAPDWYKEVVNIINSKDSLSNFSRCTKLITIWILQELSNSLENEFPDKTTREQKIEWIIYNHDILEWILNYSADFLNYLKNNPQYIGRLPIDIGNGIIKTIEITNSDVYKICKWGIINL